MNFTQKELDLFKSAAEASRKKHKDAGLHPEKTYEEYRYEFALDYARGSSWTTLKALKFFHRIKSELRKMKSAGPANSGASLTGVGEKNTSSAPETRHADITNSIRG